MQGQTRQKSAIMSTITNVTYLLQMLHAEIEQQIREIMNLKAIFVHMGHLTCNM